MCISVGTLLYVLICAIYVMQVKQPGLDMSTVQSELDLSYMQRYQGVTIPEAYERLILDTYDSISYYIYIFALCLFSIMH